MRGQKEAEEKKKREFMYLSLLKEMFVYIFVTEAKETIKIGTEIFICESMRIKNIHTHTTICTFHAIIFDRW